MIPIADIYKSVIYAANANSSLVHYCLQVLCILISCSFSVTGCPEETAPGEHQRQTLERPDEQTDATHRTRWYVSHGAMGDMTNKQLNYPTFTPADEVHTLGIYSKSFVNRIMIESHLAVLNSGVSGNKCYFPGVHKLYYTTNCTIAEGCRKMRI